MYIKISKASGKARQPPRARGFAIYVKGDTVTGDDEPPRGRARRR